MQTALRHDLPAGDLPQLLQDGSLLLELADAALPGVAAPLAAASPEQKLRGFVSACEELGVEEEALLRPETLLPGPARSAAELAAAIDAMAVAAAAKGLLPPLLVTSF